MLINCSCKIKTTKETSFISNNYIWQAMWWENIVESLSIGKGPAQQLTVQIQGYQTPTWVIVGFSHCVLTVCGLQDIFLSIKKNRTNVSNVKYQTAENLSGKKTMRGVCVCVCWKDKTKMVRSSVMETQESWLEKTSVISVNISVLSTLILFCF